MDVLGNYNKVLNAITKYSNENITLVAVSKYAHESDMNVLYENGYGIFGENRVENLISKQKSFPLASWHLIGSLQTRKVKDIIGKVSLIHSLDREKLATEINKRSEKENIITNCLIQVNVAKEESKSGLYIEEVEDFLFYLRDLDYISIKGFMTMAPFVENPEDVRHVFKGLRKLRDDMTAKGYVGLNELSMGMSNDYIIAIQEGATIVRIGSEIFK